MPLRIALGALLVLATSVAQAQGPRETAVAREQFERGIAAARSSDWETARDAFERSYGLVARPTTLINWASALVRTGRLVEGAERYREFLRTARDARSRRQRSAARAALDAVLPRLAHAVIEVQGYAPGDAIAIDSEPVSPAVLGEELPIDPGAHLVTVTRSGRTVSHDMTVGEGQRVAVTLDASSLEPPREAQVAETPLTPAPRTAPVEEEGDTGFFESPITWIVAGALVVGGAVAVGFALSADNRDPFAGSVPPYRVGVE